MNTQVFQSNKHFKGDNSTKIAKKLKDNFDKIPYS